MENDESDDNGSESGSETFEVAKILSICYGDPNKSGKSALYFKVSGLSRVYYLDCYENPHAYNEKQKQTVSSLYSVRAC